MGSSFRKREGNMEKSNVSVSVLLSQWTSAFNVGIPVCLLFRWLLLIHSSIQPGSSLRVACDFLPTRFRLHSKWKKKWGGS